MPDDAKPWNVHDHRDELEVSDGATIYHREQGVLCWRERQWDCFLWHPISFKTHTEAYRWIREGYIAELQEGLSILQVEFSLKLFERRPLG